MTSNKVLNRQAIVSLLTIFLGLGVCSSYAGDVKPKYDLPVEITSLSESSRPKPPRTVLDFDSTADAIADTARAVVWLKFKADDEGNLNDIGVVYSSHHNLGLEERAVFALKAASFERIQPFSRRKPKVLYYEVVFDRAQYRLLTGTEDDPPKNIDSTESLPVPDEFVPLSKLPEMIKAGLPEFPRDARNTVSRATIWIKVLIDSTGHVRNSIIGKSCGNASLDSAAVKSGWKSIFSPGRNEQGAAVSCWASYKVEYKVEK